MSDTNHNPTQAELDAIEAEADALLDAADAGAGVDPTVLDQVAAERDEWKDRALRVAAEMENLKRRSEAQQNDARAFAIQRFAKDLLPVADSLQRALQAAPKDSEGPAAALVAGLELVEKSLQGAFAEMVPGGTVLQTMQAGYELFGRTIRPAMVVVAAKGSGSKAQPQGGYAQAPDANGTAHDSKA